MFLMNDKPNKKRIILSEFELNEKDIYYVSFIYQGQIRTRRIQLVEGCYGVYNSNWSNLIRVETKWKFLFKNSRMETESVAYVVSDFDRINIGLVGITEREAIMKFLIGNFGKNNIPDNEEKIINLEMEFYKNNFKHNMEIIAKEFNKKPVIAYTNNYEQFIGYVDYSAKDTFF